MAVKPDVEGKTKVVYIDQSDTRFVEILSKDSITVGDGVHEWEVPNKGVVVTALNHCTMSLLNEQGIATHYCDLTGPNTFVAERLDMFKVEVVVRDSAEGSYLVRHPDVKKGHVFDQPIVECFYKNDAEHDPLMLRNEEGVIQLYKAKEPIGPNSYIRDLDPGEALLPTADELLVIQSEAPRTFAITKDAFGRFNFYPPDGKVEYGRSHVDGKVKLGDVWDCESFRMRDECGYEISKEVLRVLVAAKIEITQAILQQILWNYSRIATVASQFGSA